MKTPAVLFSAVIVLAQAGADAGAGAPEMFRLLSSLGSASLAALAVWWLTNKHERAVQVITDGHKQAFESVVQAIKDVGEAQEKRDTQYQELADRKLKVLVEVAVQLQTNNAKIIDLERRLEGMERVLALEDKVGGKK